MASEDDFSLRLDSLSCNDAIEFGNHKNADHLIRPVLKVPAIEVREVRDRQSSGFVVGQELGCMSVCRLIMSVQRLKCTAHATICEPNSVRVSVQTAIALVFSCETNNLESIQR